MLTLLISSVSNCPSPSPHPRIHPRPPPPGDPTELMPTSCHIEHTMSGRSQVCKVSRQRRGVSDLDARRADSSLKEVRGRIITLTTAVLPGPILASGCNRARERSRPSANARHHVSKGQAGCWVTDPLPTAGVNPDRAWRRTRKSKSFWPRNAAF